MDNPLLYIYAVHLITEVSLACTRSRLSTLALRHGRTRPPLRIRRALWMRPEGAGRRCAAAEPRLAALSTCRDVP